MEWFIELLKYAGVTTLLFGAFYAYMQQSFKMWESREKRDRELFDKVLDKDSDEREREYELLKGSINNTAGMMKAINETLFEVKEMRKQTTVALDDLFRKLEKRIS